MHTKFLNFIAFNYFISNREGRVNFSIRKFVEKYHLGPQPSAGSFYQAQWDEYVTIRNQAEAQTSK